MDEGENRSNLMANVSVTIRAFDLVVRDMILMHELRGVFRAQDFWLIMTLNTFPLGNMAISLNDVDMAFLACHPPGNIFPMVETPTLDINVSFGLDVTRGTSPNGTRDALLLPFRPSPVVMTDEAVDFMDGQMGPLNELGMAGGATKFHPSSQLPQMFSMGEGHILIDHISLNLFNFVTPLLETTRIPNLSMGPARRLPGDKIGQ
jgi:hypothetical protein